MRVRSIFLSFLLVPSLLGCYGRAVITAGPPTASASPSSTAALSADAGLVPSPTPSATSLPALTPSPPATATPSLSPLIPPQGELAAQCLKILPELPPEAGIEGVLVLDSRLEVNRRVTRDTFLLDLATGASRQIANLPDENQIYHRVSPDRTLLAYRSSIFNASDNIINRELVIAGADGQRLESISWEEGWLGPLGWLDNHRLVISLAGLDPHEASGQKPSTLFLFDPFTGQRQVLEPDYTGIDGAPTVGFDFWGGTLIDPTLTRVIYPYLGDDGIYTYALWDLQQQKLVETLEAVFAGPVSTDWAPMPVWSQDGSRLVVEGMVEDVNGKPTAETFLVTRDGQVEQLTEFYKYKNAGLTEFSWSPDGRYLAAWLSLIENNYTGKGSDLVVVDTQTRQIIDYCINTDLPIRPVWSPDGRQLVVTERTDIDLSTNRYRVILVDLARGFAAQIKEDVEAFGWMVAP